MILNHGVNVLQIAAQVVELLPPGISNAFPGLLAALIIKFSGAFIVPIMDLVSV